MAGCEETPNLEGFAAMDAREASKKRRVLGRQFAESRFGKQCLAKDEQEPSIDFVKGLSSEVMMPLKEKVNKAMLAAVGALDGQRKRFSGAAAAAETAIDKIQTEKMDKIVVEVVDGEKNRVSTITSGAPVETGTAAFDSMQTEKMDKCAESDPPAGVHGKRRLPDQYVSLVLAMPRENLVDPEDLSFIDDLAKLMNRSDDWIEERKKSYLERAALSKRINERFVEFQDRMSEEWLAKGYVETERDMDARDAMLEKFNSDLWKEHNARRLALSL